MSFLTDFGGILPEKNFVGQVGGQPGWPTFDFSKLNQIPSTNSKIQLHTDLHFYVIKP